jgi:DNA-3-methyladenine glycosylase I
MKKEPVRCGWATWGSDLMLQYHDEEWCTPHHDDRALYELLVLEGAQAGLSWNTILNKRENYRKAFGRFDFNKVARFTTEHVERLMADSGIVRNRLKIESAISNAQAVIRVRKDFGTFDAYVWGFVGGKTKHNAFKELREIPSTTPESDAMSKDLKKRGFRFVGSTICYAFMQGAGLVNDHEVTCFRYKELR